MTTFAKQYAIGYSVRFVNHHNHSIGGFNTVEEAVSYGKRAHFDFAVDRHHGAFPSPSVLVCAWDAIGGLRWYDDDERASFYPGDVR